MTGICSAMRKPARPSFIHQTPVVNVRRLNIRRSFTASEFIQVGIRKSGELTISKFHQSYKHYGNAKQVTQVRLRAEEKRENADRSTIDTFKGHRSLWMRCGGSAWNGNQDEATNMKETEAYVLVAFQQANRPFASASSSNIRSQLFPFSHQISQLIG